MTGRRAVLRLVLMLGLGLGLGACGPKDPGAETTPRSAERQQPSRTTPGVQVSGHATFGVIKRF